MDKEKRLEDIYDAALEEFSLLGYERATITSIASRLRMTKGNLYFFIRSKEELYEQAVSNALETWQRNVFEQVAAVADPRERFKRLCACSYEYLLEDPRLRTILTNDSTLFPIDPLARERFSEIHLRSIHMIRDILEEGIEREIFREDFDTDHISQLIYSVYVMFIVKTYILVNEHSFNSYFDEAVELILQGVLKK